MFSRTSCKYEIHKVSRLNVHFHMVSPVNHVRVHVVHCNNKIMQHFS